MLKQELSIASITVAWNAQEVIRAHLRALLEQSRPLDEIIVVDNASHDETPELLRKEFPTVTVLRLAENLGVGGGLSEGLEYAFRKGHNWFWLFDQDSVAAPTALEELLKGLASVPANADSIGILASLPVHRETGFEHFGLLWKNRFLSVPEERARQAVCMVDLVISSGSLVRREVVEHVGLPRPDFFIDFVDHEYNLRIRRHGYEIALVRDSILYHHLGEVRIVGHRRGRPRVRSFSATWRHYYMSRNEVFTVWHLFGNAKSRSFLMLRMLRRAARIAWCDESKLSKLKMHFMGIRDGLMKDFTRRRDQLPEM